MLQPRKFEFRKHHKGKIKGLAVRGSDITFGSYGIKAIDRGLVSAKQIDNIKVIISRNFGKTGKMWINIFPDKPITRKGVGQRMGGGTGNTEFWAAVVRPGQVMFELDYVSMDVAKHIASLIDDKLPMPVKLVLRQDIRTM